MKKRIFKQASTLALATLLSFAHLANADAPFSPYVDKEGVITMPSDFRANFSHLGSWFVPNGDASGFHDVYTDQDTISSFRKNGHFPDGAVLVKELRAHSTGNYSTGENVSYANSTVKQWFVMIRDTENRFSNHPLWGDGWGWALFKTDDPKRNVASNYKEDCIGCHLPAKEKELIYTEAYPTLQH